MTGYIDEKRVKRSVVLREREDSGRGRTSAALEMTILDELPRDAPHALPELSTESFWSRSTRRYSGGQAGRTC